MELYQDSVDRALLAYILKGAAPVLGNTKAQKTCFWVELRLRAKRLVGPHFRFYRYKYGAYSDELRLAHEALVLSGHLHKNNKLTDRGEILVEFVEELRKHNRAAFNTIDRAISECQSDHGEALKTKFYELEIRPEDWDHPVKIRVVPEHTDLIRPKGRELIVPDAIRSLITDELKLSDTDLKRAHDTWPQWGRKGIEALERLIAASTDAREQSS
jgi:uncharacterized protein YwgA